MTFYSTIAMLGLLGTVGLLGGAFIYLSERIDKIEESRERLWKQIRNQVQINIMLRSRLYMLEQGKQLAEPDVIDLGQFNPQNSHPYEDQVTALRGINLPRKQAD